MLTVTRLKRALKFMVARLACVFYKSSPLSTSQIKQQVTELRKAFSTIQEFNLANIESRSEREWSNNLNVLLRHIRSQDNPIYFLNWSVIQATMFPTHPNYVIHEYSYLKKLQRWAEYWRPRLIENKMGTPFPFMLNWRTSANLVHHYFHLAKFTESCGIKDFSNFDTILEFGGGYGSLCRAVYRLGFTGKYIIFDLEHFSTLQTFYLRSLGYSVSNESSALEEHQPGIICTSQIDQLYQICEKLNKGNSLFIATWSLSETPIQLREKIVDHLLFCRYFLIAYQYSFGEVDNQAFFDAFKKKSQQVSWQEEEISHMPGNKYLIGKP